GENCNNCGDCACKTELGEICNTIGTISNCIINPHVDCPNSVCGAGEDCTNCPSDCGVCPPGTCNNNGACNAELGENCNNCGDCACKTELGETCNAIGECINILVDCPDGQCGIEENCKNCEDCACDPASGKTCSDSGVCEGETPITCGDGSCRVEDGEDCNNCEDCDCGSDKVCNAIGECIDPLVKCGNSVCDPGENCNNCPDCKCDETKEYCNMGVCTKPPIPPVFDRINPTSCSELDTQSKCSNKLNWNDAVISTIEDHNSVLRANDFCGNKKYTITSGGCEGYFKCGCIWDMDYGRCLEYLDFTETKACTASADCYTDLNVLGDCKTEDEYTLKWTASWKDKNSGYKNEDTGCTDGQKTLPCPDKEVMVPFFNIVNLVVAIIAIILIYLAIKNRKKLFKKTNNNSGKKIKKKKKR
ncbi:MAG TPA: hypothetical protein P5277_04765, partial [Candidatus Paceibacterota bacterium]|nr:hypothetical protein [Candidatus Paceibacterota bacterium]